MLNLCFCVLIAGQIARQNTTRALSQITSFRDERTRVVRFWGRGVADMAFYVNSLVWGVETLVIPVVYMCLTSMQITFDTILQLAHFEYVMRFSAESILEKSGMGKLKFCVAGAAKGAFKAGAAVLRVWSADLRCFIR